MVKLLTFCNEAPLSGTQIESVLRELCNYPRSDRQSCHSPSARGHLQLGQGRGEEGDCALPFLSLFMSPRSWSCTVVTLAPERVLKAGCCFCPDAAKFQFFLLLQPQRPMCSLFEDFSRYQNINGPNTPKAVLLWCCSFLPICLMACGEWDRECLGQTKERVLLFHYSAIIDGKDSYKEYQIIASWGGGS